MHIPALLHNLSGASAEQIQTCFADLCVCAPRVHAHVLAYLVACAQAQHPESLRPAPGLGVLERIRMVRSVERIGAWGHAGALFGFYAEDPVPAVRQEVADQLAGFGEAGFFVDLISLLCADTFPTVRAAGLETVGRSGHRALALHLLRQGFDDPVPEVRRAALRGLCLHLGAAEVLSTLRRALGDSSLEVQLEGLKLSRHVSPEDRPQLLRGVLFTREAVLRQEATEQWRNLFPAGEARKQDTAPRERVLYSNR